MAWQCNVTNLAMTTPRTNRPTLFTQSHLKLSVQNDLIQPRTPLTPPGFAMFQQSVDNPSVRKGV